MKLKENCKTICHINKNYKAINGFISRASRFKILIIDNVKNGIIYLKIIDDTLSLVIKKT